MDGELSQIIEEYLATLERDIRYLKKEINNIDGYEGNMSSNQMMINLLTKNLLIIRGRQDIMSKELELDPKRLAEIQLEIYQL